MDKMAQEKRRVDYLSAGEMDLSDMSKDLLPSEINQNLASTTPKKRVLLDLDRGTGRVSSFVTVRNRTTESLAYRCQCSHKTGYVLDPKQGLIKPGANQTINIHLQENELIDWNLDKDLFVIGIAASNRGNPSDYVFQEKYLLTCGVSPAAISRIEQLNIEKRRKKKEDEEREHYNRNVTWLLFTCLVLGTSLFSYVNFCPDS